MASSEYRAPRGDAVKRDGNPPCLEARGVWKWLGPRSGDPALRDVSLVVQEGSLTAISGPSGSGKTTLLALLGVLDHPSEGEVVFRGRSLGGWSGIALARRRREIGFVFQDFALIPRLPIWENVTYPLIPRGVGERERMGRARDALGELAMSAALLKRPEELSGGERQRAAVARVLACNPTVVIADEPTSNLDPEAAAAVRASLLKLHEKGATVVVATHDPELIALAHQVISLRQGEVVSSQ